MGRGDRSRKLEKNSPPWRESAYLFTKQKTAATINHCFRFITAGKIQKMETEQGVGEDKGNIRILKSEKLAEFKGLQGVTSGKNSGMLIAVGDKKTEIPGCCKSFKNTTAETN